MKIHSADNESVFLRLLLLAVLTSAPGCQWTPKPYSNDPLVLQHRAKLGDFDRPVHVVPIVEPQAPTLPPESVSVP